MLRTTTHTQGNHSAARQQDPAAISRLCFTVVAFLLLWPALHFSELNPSVLFNEGNNQAMGMMLNGAWPPAHSQSFLELVGNATLDTIAIAIAGIALALPIAAVASLLATHALSRSSIEQTGSPSAIGRSIRWSVRGLLILLRSVPEIVWALLFVRGVGLGPTAGVLAIAITYSGMLGKMYAEIFESVDHRPAQALFGGGASRLTAFFYGILPNASRELLSYTVYRWECALRASVVMGFVGAGGLGQQLELSLRMFAGNEVVTILLVFILLVLLADFLSRQLRARLT